jgi:GT2 family glycosyltransferase
MISIIIPNYNGEKYINQCIESVTLDSDYMEIIIIDNKSTDMSVRNIRKYSFPLIANTQNFGFAYAVNQGIRQSKGELILLLNNDAFIESSFLSELIKTIESDPNIFSVSSKMLQYHQPELIDDAGDDYTLLGWTLKRGDGMHKSKYSQTAEVFSACAGAALYRKSILEEIGLFDENFFAYMEDVDIGYRARIHGYKNIYCPDAICYHVGSATSGSKYNAFKVKLAARNNIYVVYKNMPLLQLLINLPFILLGMFIKYIFFVRKGLGKEYRQGVREGLKTLHKIKKVPFRWKHLWNYIRIEGLLILNLFRYIRELFLKKINKQTQHKS